MGSNNILTDEDVLAAIDGLNSILARIAQGGLGISTGLDTYVEETKSIYAIAPMFFDRHPDLLSSLDKVYAIFNLPSSRETDPLKLELIAIGEIWIQALAITDNTFVSTIKKGYAFDIENLTPCRKIEKGEIEALAKRIGVYPMIKAFYNEVPLPDIIVF